MAFSMVGWVMVVLGQTNAPLSPAEYGHGLSAADAAKGWIALFDGATTLGWRLAETSNGTLTRGMTASRFAAMEVRAEVVQAGTLESLQQLTPLPIGETTFTLQSEIPTGLRLGRGLALRKLAVRPLELSEILRDADFADWKRIDRPNIPADRRPAWNMKNGILHAKGGPGALEYTPRTFGDFVLQVDAKSLVQHGNGGVFFRSIPHDFLNGYEAQIYSRCEGNDPARPSLWATGAIDDRQNARRLVSRDQEWFTLTVLADGPHLATWVNGYQVTDWTDTRAAHDNPRRGRRLQPGTIQLQAHDAHTDLHFRNLRLGVLLTPPPPVNAPLPRGNDTPK